MARCGSICNNEQQNDKAICKQVEGALQLDGGHIDPKARRFQRGMDIMGKSALGIDTKVFDMGSAGKVHGSDVSAFTEREKLATFAKATDPGKRNSGRTDYGSIQRLSWSGHASARLESFTVSHLSDEIQNYEHMNRKPAERRVTDLVGQQVRNISNDLVRFLNMYTDVIRKHVDDTEDDVFDVLDHTPTEDDYWVEIYRVYWKTPPKREWINEVLTEIYDTYGNCGLRKSRNAMVMMSRFKKIYTEDNGSMMKFVNKGCQETKKPKYDEFWDVEDYFQNDDVKLAFYLKLLSFNPAWKHREMFDKWGEDCSIWRSSKSPHKDIMTERKERNSYCIQRDGYGHFEEDKVTSILRSDGATFVAAGLVCQRSSANEKYETTLAMLTDTSYCPMESEELVLLDGMGHTSIIGSALPMMPARLLPITATTDNAADKRGCGVVRDVEKVRKRSKTTHKGSALEFQLLV